MIAAGGDDCIVRVYSLNVTDFKTSDKIFELEGHFEPINSLDFSKDNKLLVSSSLDKSCLIFNLEKKG